MNFSEAVNFAHGLAALYSHYLMLAGILMSAAGVMAFKNMGQDDSGAMMQRQGGQGTIALVSLLIGAGCIYFGTVLDNTTLLFHNQVLTGTSNPLSWSATDTVSLEGNDKDQMAMFLIAYFQLFGLLAIGNGFSSIRDAAEVVGKQRREILNSSLMKMAAGTFMLIPGSFVGFFSSISPFAANLADYINKHSI